LDELVDSLDISIKQNDSYDKEEIMMYKYIADMISQRAEKLKTLQIN